MCEVCKCQQATDIHHINQQCDADSVDLLDTLDAGIFNKNKLWNLVALCKRCHQAVHSIPARLVIKGYIPTSGGVELGLTWVALDNSSSTLETKREHIHSHEPEIEQEIELELELNKAKPIIKCKHRQLDITPEMRRQILEMKSNNATPKKIQFDMKRYWSLDITQQQIREII